MSAFQKKLDAMCTPDPIQRRVHDALDATNVQLQEAVRKLRERAEKLVPALPSLLKLVK